MTETIYQAGESEDSSTRLSTAFSKGSVLADKYVIEKTIAEGGVGIVAVAMHMTLQQRVAIKYLKPKALERPSLVERFVREGRLAAQIRSDHVVRVHDVGILPNGAPFMVMEYLVGQDLGVVVRNGPSPIALAVDYVMQACDALAEAHSLRIVHRDIKPQNLFLAERPSNTPILKIIDFGISKAIPLGGSAGPDTEDGDRFGTPLYMSPEQLRSTSNVDARADIWALGIVLHELLTGEMPFEGDDLPQLCASVLIKPPVHLTTALRGAPVELEAIILKCLEKDRLRRFRNVAELAQELVPFGPPDAAARAGRIAEMMRRAGTSVRPPTPMPGSIEVQAVPVYLPSIAPANSTDRLTPGGRRRPYTQYALTVIAILVALVSSGALVFRTFAPRGASGSPTAVRVSSPDEAPVAVAPLGPASAPNASPLPVLPASSSSSPTTATAAVPTGALVTPPKRVSPAAPAPPRASAVPAIRSHPRSEFGERE